MKSLTNQFAPSFAALLLLCPLLSAAGGEPYGLDISSAKVVISSNQHSSKEEELVEQLQKVVKEYFVVSKNDWTHKYSHVALGDSTGTIEWTGKDPKIWQWMLRPGGLATITDENGITTYLAEVVN